MDKLLDKAYAYKKTKLWNRLADNCIVVIVYSDGTTGYCSFKHIGESNTALALYEGAEGLQQLREYLDVKPADSQQLRTERANSLDCVSCSFVCLRDLFPKEVDILNWYCDRRDFRTGGRNAFAHLEHIRPRTAGRMLQDDTDKAHLSEALSVCLSLAELLSGGRRMNKALIGAEPGQECMCAQVQPDGSVQWSTAVLPERTPPAPPEDVLYNELQAAKLRREPQRSGEWYVDLFISPICVYEEPGENFVPGPDDVKAWPMLGMALDFEGKVITYKVYPSSTPQAVTFVNELLQAMTQYGRPTEIHVINDRMYHMLTRLAKYLDIRLTLGDSKQILQNAEDTIYARILDPFFGRDDYDDDFDDDDDEDDDEDDDD